MNGLRIRLEELIQSRHLLETSFYKRWTAGNVSREELQGYAKEYYQFEKEFPRFISAVHSKCEDLEMRQMLLENLIDEERGENNHPELWMRFAEGLGVRREELQNHFHSDETEHLLRNFREATGSAHVVDGLAALYAYERQQPEVVRQKIDGLKRYYGLSEDRAVDFFRVHQVADVHHAETEISLLERLCDDEEMKERAVLVVQRTLDTLYDFLDGVERRYRPAA
ncbi:MAG: CADD family putative folate metabolism protein [Bdellovibrionales bacterium]|nr:CADD family putative folate metabolism protein [Bdellovibrionales bacterium]